MAVNLYWAALGDDNASRCHFNTTKPLTELMLTMSNETGGRAFGEIWIKMQIINDNGSGIGNA